MKREIASDVNMATKGIFKRKYRKCWKISAAEILQLATGIMGQNIERSVDLGQDFTVLG